MILLYKEKRFFKNTYIFLKLWYLGMILYLTSIKNILNLIELNSFLVIITLCFLQ